MDTSATCPYKSTECYRDVKLILYLRQPVCVTRSDVSADCRVVTAQVVTLEVSLRVKTGLCWTRRVSGFLLLAAWVSLGHWPSPQ